MTATVATWWELTIFVAILFAIFLIVVFGILSVTIAVSIRRIVKTLEHLTLDIEEHARVARRDVNRVLAAGSRDGGSGEQHSHRVPGGGL